MSKHPIIGRWRIIESDMWDKDYLDLVEPAKAIFDDQGHGELIFGVVDVGLSLKYSPTMIAFTFEGDAEGDEVNGSGWADILEDGTLEIEFNFLNGDEAMFKAISWAEG
jgi:hypothetical protein